MIELLPKLSINDEIKLSQEAFTNAFVYNGVLNRSNLNVL